MRPDRIAPAMMMMNPLMQTPRPRSDPIDASPYVLGS